MLEVIILLLRVSLGCGDCRGLGEQPRPAKWPLPARALWRCWEGAEVSPGPGAEQSCDTLSIPISHFPTFTQRGNIFPPVGWCLFWAAVTPGWHRACQPWHIARHRVALDQDPHCWHLTAASHVSPTAPRDEVSALVAAPRRNPLDCSRKSTSKNTPK